MTSVGPSIEEPNGSYRVVVPMDEATAADVRCVCSALHACRSPVYLKVYSSQRIKTILATLKAVELSNSVSAPYTDGPYERGSHVFTRYVAVASELLGAEVSLAHSVLPQNSEESAEAMLKITKTVLDDLAR